MPASVLNNTTFTGESIFNGTMKLPQTIAGEFKTSNNVQRQRMVFNLPLHDFCIHDAIQNRLPNPSATDDLGLYGATFGTNATIIQTYDVKAAGAQTLYARFPDFVIPYNYDPGETIELLINAGMVGAVADTSCTLDVECFVNDGEGGYSGVDRYVGAALTMNSLTFAGKQFDLGNGLNPGDHLDIRIGIAVNDAAGGSPVQAAFGRAAVRCDTRG